MADPLNPASSSVPDASDLAAGEMGYPQPQAKPLLPGLPPGGGALVFPHFQSFSQIINSASRVYRWTHDEALKDSRTNALAYRRDPVVMEALRARQMPTAQVQWHLEPQDENDRQQQLACKHLTEILGEIPRFQQLKLHLLEALWFGRYGVQMTYGWDFSRKSKDGKPSRRLVVRDHRPINGDKLVFRYSGQVGVLVHAQFPGEWQITDRGRAHFFSPEEREQVLIHRHEPEDADFWEGDLAGGVHGVGIRGRLYWFLWLRAQVMAWLMDFLERVGAGGFTVFYYEAGNPESLAESQKAAEEQNRNNAILFPRYRDGSGGPGIQRIEPSQAGAQLLEALIINYFDVVIRRFILGQSLSAEASGTGLGSGVASFHQETLNRILKFDAINLQETLTSDLVAVLAKYNCPGIPCPRFTFDVDKPNAAEHLEAAERFYQMGGALDEDGLRSVLGLAKPKPGNAILSKIDSLSPEAVGSMPQGVPMMGQPGPQLPGGTGMDEGPGVGRQAMDGQILRALRQMGRQKALRRFFRTSTNGYRHAS